MSSSSSTAAPSNHPVTRLFFLYSSFLFFSFRCSVSNKPSKIGAERISGPLRGHPDPQDLCPLHQSSRRRSSISDAHEHSGVFSPVFHFSRGNKLRLIPLLLPCRCAVVGAPTFRALAPCWRLVPPHHPCSTLSPVARTATGTGSRSTWQQQQQQNQQPRARRW